MKNVIMFSLLLILCIFSNGCLSTGQRTKQEVVKEFIDNGRTVDSLQKAFQCESITLDKWKSSEVTDSTFSFCLINAKAVPAMDMAIGAELLKKIARAVKKTVKNPAKYNSYQIVFVKSDKSFAGGIQSQELGGTISNNDL